MPETPYLITHRLYLIVCVLYGHHDLRKVSFTLVSDQSLVRLKWHTGVIQERNVNNGLSPICVRRVPTYPSYSFFLF